MDLKEIGNSTRNWVDSVQDRDLKEIGVNMRNFYGSGLLESPCECDIEPPGSTGLGVSYKMFYACLLNLFIIPGDLQPSDRTP